MDPLLPTMRSPADENEIEVCNKIFFTPEIVVEIFKFLSSYEPLSKLTCHFWNNLTTSIAKAKFGIGIGKFPFFIQPTRARSECLPLTPFLKSWSYTIPKFSCVTQDLIAYKPTSENGLFVDTSSDQFTSLKPSFPLPFIENSSLLAQCGDTYLFRSSKDQSLFVIKKMATEEKWEMTQFSHIPGVTDLNGETFCYSVSDNKMVLICCSEAMTEAICLNLTTKEIIYRLPLRDKVYSPNKLGNHLILNTSTIDLDADHPRKTRHGFDFMSCWTTVFESSLYVSKMESLQSFSMSPTGELEKKWELKDLSSDGRKIFILGVKSVNDKYIALDCQSQFQDNLKGFRCIQLLDTQGQCIHQLQLPIPFGSILMHLVDDILIYKHPQEVFLIFLHIPTKQLINKLEWKDPINDTIICDIHSTNNKLSLLSLMTINDERKYQVIQFDLQEIMQA